MECSKEGCNGELIKVRKYYVCDTCCSDTTTFDEVIKIAAEGRNVLQDKPKGRSVQIKNPEYMGFYPYTLTRMTKWRKTFKLKGKDGSIVGSLVFADYTKCKFITSGEPKYMAHLHHKDYIITVTIQEEDIKFHG